MLVYSAVLLPGLDGTGELFSPFVDAAPEGIRTVVVSYPRDEHSMAALERHARSQLVDSCVVIAESFSGPIGVRIASDPRVRALVLCNSFITSPISSYLRHLAIAPLFAIPFPQFALRAMLLGNQASPDFTRKVQSTIRSVPPRTLAQRVRQVAQLDERTAARELAKPILYLRGNSDRLVPESCWTSLKHVRPDAEIVRIAGPHLLLQTSPKECWQAIAAFTRGIF